MERYERWMGADDAPLADRVARVFTCLAGHARNPKWRGCGFLRVAVELADLPGQPARYIASAHKKRFEAWLQEEIEAVGLPEAANRAMHLMIVLDGAMLQMIVHKDTSHALTAAALARTILAERAPWAADEYAWWPSPLARSAASAAS